VIHRWNDLATPSRPVVRLHEVKQSSSENPTDAHRCESMVLAACCGAQPPVTRPGTASGSAASTLRAMTQDDEEQGAGKAPDRDSASRWTRDQKLKLLEIAAAAVVALIVGALGTWVALRRGTTTTASSGQPAATHTATTRSARAGAGKTTQIEQEPSLNPNANCATVRQAADEGGGGARLFVDSPGSIGGGARSLEVRVLPNGRWHQVVQVTPGEEVELSARLFNGDYGSAQEVVVWAKVPERWPGCWRIIAGTRGAKSDPLEDARFGPVLVYAPTSAGAQVFEYVAASTRLLEAHEDRVRELAKLPDGVLGGEVAIPYAVPPAALDVYYVNWRARVR
jgi:hypothetical protein